MNLGAVTTGVVGLLFCSFSILFLLDFINAEAKYLSDNEDSCQAI